MLGGAGEAAATAATGEQGPGAGGGGDFVLSAVASALSCSSFHSAYNAEYMCVIVLLQALRGTGASSSAAAAAASTNSISTTCFALSTPSLVQATAGVLLMLLTRDAGQGALLAPEHAAVLGPRLSTGLPAMQRSLLEQVLENGGAAELLAAADRHTWQQWEQAGNAGPAAGGVSAVGAASAPQLQAACKQMGEQVLQQVLLCCRWVAATQLVSIPPATRTGSQHTSGLWGVMRWLTGSSSSSSSGMSATHQRTEQVTNFDWQQLHQGLRQASRDAAVCLQLVCSQEQQPQQPQQQRRVPPDAFLCPISHELMTEPVVASDGHTYQRQAIVQWIQVRRAGRWNVCSAVCMCSVSFRVLGLGWLTSRQLAGCTQ